MSYARFCELSERISAASNGKLPLCGRENERNTLNALISKKVRDASGGISLIGGSTGIGKTMIVMNILDQIEQQGESMFGQKIRTIRLNVGKFTSSRDLLNRICLAKAFGNCHRRKKTVSSEKYLEMVFSRVSKRPYIILMLDEFENLHTRKESENVLYNIIEWTMHENSRLFVVGILNRTDFKKLVPLKLASRIPDTHFITFADYTEDQLSKIFDEILGSTKVFTEEAKSVFVKKMGNKADCDMRIFFGTLRIILNYKRRQIAKKIQERESDQCNLESEHCDSFQSELSLDSLPSDDYLITTGDVLKIVNEGIHMSLAGLPIYHQLFILVCALCTEERSDEVLRFENIVQRIQRMIVKHNKVCDPQKKLQVGTFSLWMRVFQGLMGTGYVEITKVKNLNAFPTFVFHTHSIFTQLHSIQEKLNSPGEILSNCGWIGVKPL